MSSYSETLRGYKKSAMRNKKIKIILHACTMKDWIRAKKFGEYRAESLNTQGFIHCSESKTIAKVANSHWKGRKDLILLVIDSQKVKKEIKYESDPKSGTFYPHIYGSLNLDAIIDIRVFSPNSTGYFTKFSVNL